MFFSRNYTISSILYSSGRKRRTENVVHAEPYQAPYLLHLCSLSLKKAYIHVNLFGTTDISLRRNLHPENASETNAASTLRQLEKRTSPRATDVV